MPWFIDWDDYRTNFEVEAGKILGQPVRVIGSASASILPSPSLTFTEVEVGEIEGQPMMTVERFEVTIELMPLLQGEIHVVSMELARPIVRVSVDDAGTVDWLRRSEASEALDPEKVVLENVQVTDGAVIYADARTGIDIGIDNINAAIAARALSGPWRVEGSYLDNGVQVPFRFTTGRRLDDGTIRVKSDFSPAMWPVAVSADGVIGESLIDGLTYSGTYNVTEVTTGPQGEQGELAGWRSEGSFAVARDRLVIDKAVLSSGPEDRSSSMAGSLSIDFGEEPYFDAQIEARQLDLDRALGAGPSQPVEVAVASTRLVDWLTQLPIPDMPGRISFDIPVIVVGGAIIQGVNFEAQPALAGWQIAGFSASLPGQASIAADGVLTTGERVGFVGDARLTVDQPATFAAWWRGHSEQQAGRLLSSFDLAGQTEIAPGRVSVDDIDARIGDATITGRFAWSESERDGHRHLGTDLKADAIDYAQLRALSELLVGRDLTDTGVLADSYSIRLSAGAFVTDRVTLRDVAVDAAYAEDVLTVNQLAVGDIGGTGFNVTRGRIDNLTQENMRGTLDARLEAASLDGLARVVDRLAPDSAVSRWLADAAPSLAPAVINARIEAPPTEGGEGIRLTLDGVAGDTTLAVSVDTAGALTNWRNQHGKLSVVLDAIDPVGLARQVGFDAVTVDGIGTGHVQVEGSGIPAEGLNTVFIADVAGLTANMSGTLVLKEGALPVFNGSLGATSSDLGPLVRMTGLGIPLSAFGTPAEIDGEIATVGREIDLRWRDGTIGDRRADGMMKLAYAGEGGWNIDGELMVDQVDLGWVTALGLGFPPLPTDDPAAPWSTAPFSSPVFGTVRGRVTVEAGRLAIGDALAVSGAKLELGLQPSRVDLTMTSGQVAGGTATGGISIHNVGGDANFSGRFDLKGAALETFIWHRAGRPVATGALDIAGNFEATGRSPAALVSSMAGGGVVSISDGMVRYVNPRAFTLVIRSADIGENFSEDGLRDAFESYIDAGTVEFDNAEAAYAIAAGTARLKSLAVDATTAQMVGSAAIDFNTLTIDSDWTLTVDPGDDEVEGTVPRVGIVFRGPLADPVRIIDALPFNSYLNIRQEARIQEILIMEEQARAERERLNRLRRKLREDAARSERQAREAAEAEVARREAAIAAAGALEELHRRRETAWEELRVVALERAAERAAAESVAAADRAEQTAAAAAAERAAADQAAEALTEADEVHAAAVEAARKAADDLVMAQAAAAAAAQEANKSAAEADATAAALAQSVEEGTAVQDLAETAVAAKTEADRELEIAAAEAGTARDATGGAAVEAEAANAALKVATDAAAAASDAEDVAAEALSMAEAAMKAAEAEAARLSVLVATTTADARAALAIQRTAEENAAVASDAAAQASAARDELVLDAAAKVAVAEEATGIAREALATADAAARVAKALVAGENAAAEMVAAERNAASTAEVAAAQAALREAEAQAARAAADEAQAALDAASAKASEATANAAGAMAVVKAATAEADRAAAAAEAAGIENTAADQAVAEQTTAWEAAREVLAERRTAAQEAAAALAAAEEVAEAANAALASARTRSDSADAALAAAEGEAVAKAEAALSAAEAVEAGEADRAEYRQRADDADARAAAAATAMSEASDALAAAMAAQEAAEATLQAATDRKAAAAQEFAEADQRARAAEAVAAAAAKEAAVRAAAAEAAKAAAERAAAGTAWFDTAGEAADRRSVQSAAAALLPATADGVAAPPSPPPRKPMVITPSAASPDQPLPITPPVQ